MHYFVYKNGKGNCWGDFTQEQATERHGVA